MAQTHQVAVTAWRSRRASLFRATFTPPPRLTIDEWADRYRWLSATNSVAQVPWRTDYVPPIRGILRTIADPRMRKVVIMKSAQVSYTEGVIGNCIGYFIHQRPRSMMVVQPSRGDAEDWSKDKLQGLLDSTPVLAELIRDSRDPDGGSTILTKVFPGGQLKAVGGTSPKGLARSSLPVIFIDEVDRIPRSAGKEGNPISIVMKRQTTFADRIAVIGGTPTIEGESAIHEEFELTDQRHYHVPCPHCGHMQVLRWGGRDEPYGIKFEYRTAGKRRQVIPESVFYLCEHCACSIEERSKFAMVARGEWRPLVPEQAAPDVAGFHLSALTAPFDGVRWSNLAQELLDATGDSYSLRVFVNTRLGFPWKEAEETVDANALEERAEGYVDAQGNRVEVPMGVGVLTGFVDVQHDRLELLVRGWGEREESWMVAHHRIYGDVTLPQVWQQLEALRTRGYRHEGGAILRIAALGVDSGDGTRQNEIYDYVRPRQGQGVYATKGQPARQREPIKHGRKDPKSKIKLVHIGTYPMKTTLFSRLALQIEAGREVPFGYMHFRARDTDWHNGADAEFYAQFGREKPARKRLPSGQWITEYVQTGPNEAVDLEVGNLAMLHVLGPSVRQTLDQWVERVQREGRETREAAPADAAPQRRGRAGGRRGGWVQGWR